MSKTTLTHNSTDVTTYSGWLDIFDDQSMVRADQLERFRMEVTNSQYARTVLRLARGGKLRPKVLTDAAYTAWLKSENPKKDMASSGWTELFRRSYRVGHELFEPLG